MFKNLRRKYYALTVINMYPRPTVILLLLLQEAWRITQVGYLAEKSKVDTSYAWPQYCPFFSFLAAGVKLPLIAESIALSNFAIAPSLISVLHVSSFHVIKKPGLHEILTVVYHKPAA